MFDNVQTDMHGNANQSGGDLSYSHSGHFAYAFKGFRDARINAFESS